MARIKTTRDPYRRARNISKRLVVRHSSWGLIAQKWPRKRGPSRKPGDIWWRGTWGTAAQMSARPYALDQSFAEAWVPGTKFLPRDLLTAAALGTLFELDDRTGLIQGTVMTVAANPQATLDLITNVPGSMLFRTGAGWVQVPPGTAARFLQSNGTDRPSWVPLPGFAGAPTMSRARIGLNADQTGIDLSANHQIVWQKADYDTDGRWSLTPTPRRITFLTDDAGRTALLTANVAVTGAVTGNRAFMAIRHITSAGTVRNNSAVNLTHPGGTLVIAASLQTVAVNAGDYIDMNIFAVGATNATITARDTYLALTMLS